MGVFEAIGTDTHEEVLFASDQVSRLKTIIAIHSTALGPAFGGTRFFPYPTEDDALAERRIAEVGGLARQRSVTPVSGPTAEGACTSSCSTSTM